MRAQPIAPLFLLVAQSGCPSYHNKNTDLGTLNGAVTVRWYKPKLFVYEPDASTPLTFTRKSGHAIIPAQDVCGSIPRAFRLFRNYSPWGYGPAFIVHDWLSHAELPARGLQGLYT
jgi:hypothetical protein